MRRVTLFVNRTCSLCARARQALADLPFPVLVREIDVSRPLPGRLPDFRLSTRSRSTDGVEEEKEEEKKDIEETEKEKEEKEDIEEKEKDRKMVEAGRTAYPFDVPVIHVSRCGTSKLMHWIHRDDLLAKFAEADGPASGWRTTCGRQQSPPS